MRDRLGQWTCHICARKVAAGVMCVHGPHTKHQPTLPPAEAPPETGHAAESAAEMAERHAIEAATGERIATAGDLDRLREVKQWRAVASRWAEHAMEWSRENAALRTEVQRLTAENERLRTTALCDECPVPDQIRAQVWAEAFRVVEQMPDAAFESGHARSLWTFTNMLKRADVLAALRAAQKGRTE